jgi:hypothetical protein
VRLISILFALTVLDGCSHVTVDANSRSSAGSVVPSAGTTVTSGQSGLHVESRALAAVVLGGMVLAAAAEDARQQRPFPSFSVFSDWFRGTPAPELAVDRPVLEHDCTKPMPQFSGNLKCR